MRRFWLLLFMVFSLTGCSPRPVSRHQEVVMGVFNEVVIVGKGKEERERALAEAFQILQEIDAKMSHFKSTSEISRINQKGFEEPQPVSAETFEVIQTSFEFFEKTDGAFDVTVLPLMKLWGFYEGRPELPRDEEVQGILPGVGSRNLILDRASQKIGFRIPGMGIDLGAIAKGYACDQVIQILKSRGIEHALVNVGGTMRVYGRSPEGKPWRVGIQHPRDPTRVSKIVTLEDEALATSGDYEQFFVVGGRRYSHILDPRTGYPGDTAVAVSVIAPTAILADTLSTSLFVLGPEEAPSLAVQFPQIRWEMVYLTPEGHFKTLSSEPAP